MKIEEEKKIGQQSDVGKREDNIDKWNFSSGLSQIATIKPYHSAAI